MSPRAFWFRTTCVSSTFELISAMRENELESSLEELRANCVDLDRVLEALGYGPGFPIETDWHVSYHRSIYDGRACFFFVWSGIEHIFTEVF